MTTTTAESLSVPREAFLDALATLEAAGGIIHSLDDGDLDLVVLGQHLSEAIFRAEARLRESVLGELGDELDEHEARAAEIEADLIDEAWALRTRNEEAKMGYEREYGRSARLRVYAQQIRTVGMDDAKFPTTTAALMGVRVAGDLRRAAEAGDDAS